MIIFKSEVNEVNAVLLLKVLDNSLELTYTYDSKDLKYDEEVKSCEIINKINHYRNLGYSEKVIYNKRK